MKLNKGEIYPGEIVDIVDSFGTIRAIVYGLFTEYDNIEDLPIIKPMFMNLRNSFNQPSIGDKIYVLTSVENPRLLFYFFMCDYQTQLSSILSNNTDFKPINVIFHTDKNDDNVAYIIYNTIDENTILIQNGNSFIKMTNDIIELFNDGGNTTINMNDGIFIGKNENNSEPMLLGNKTSGLINDIINEIQSLYNILKIIVSILSSSASPVTVFGLIGASSIIPQLSRGATNIAKMQVQLDNIKSKISELD